MLKFTLKNMQLFAEQAGRINEVWLIAGSAAMTNATGAKCLGVDNATFAELCNMLEITAFSDTHKKQLPGIKDTNFSFSGNIYTGDTTGQDILIAGNSIFIGCYPQGTGVASKQVQAFISSIEKKYDVAGKQTFSCTLACSGAPVVLPLRP